MPSWTETRHGSDRAVAESATAFFWLLAAVLTSSACNESQAPPPDVGPGQIAFASDRLAQFDIYVMNANGTGIQRLTDDLAFDFWPSWSPDGSRIAFTSDRDSQTGSVNLEIYVMNADGTGVTRVTSDTAQDDEPAWSPDGTRLAFRSNRDGNAEIYVVNVDGSGLARLTTDSASDVQPAWSPDGSKIAFVTTRDANPEIYVMNANGTGVVNVSGDPRLRPRSGVVAGRHQARLPLGPRRHLPDLRDERGRLRRRTAHHPRRAERASRLVTGRLTHRLRQRCRDLRHAGGWNRSCAGNRHGRGELHPPLAALDAKGPPLQRSGGPQTGSLLPPTADGRSGT